MFIVDGRAEYYYWCARSLLIQSYDGHIDSVVVGADGEEPMMGFIGALYKLDLL